MKIIVKLAIIAGAALLLAASRQPSSEEAVEGTVTCVSGGSSLETTTGAAGHCLRFRWPLIESDIRFSNHSRPGRCPTEPTTVRVGPAPTGLLAPTWRT